MIAVDSSTIIAHIGGARGSDIQALEAAIAGNGVVIPPVVLCELLSEPALPPVHRDMIVNLPVLELRPDYWIRAAATRAAILSRRLRARLADALVAQACIDADVPLITRDRDFRHFARHCGLKLA
ncbi:MAG: PIN domain nuclease [Bauldia sp.]|nr:MAG: PIN domain nuclease [Bauldia sp.]